MVYNDLYGFIDFISVVHETEYPWQQGILSDIIIIIICIIYNELYPIAQLTILVSHTDHF